MRKVARVGGEAAWGVCSRSCRIGALDLNSHPDPCQDYIGLLQIHPSHLDLASRHCASGGDRYQHSQPCADRQRHPMDINSTMKSIDRVRSFSTLCIPFTQLSPSSLIEYMLRYPFSRKAGMANSHLHWGGVEFCSGTGIL